MNALVRRALILGIVGFGSFVIYHLLHPASTLVVELTCDGQPLGGFTTGAAWGNDEDFSWSRAGRQPYHYHLRVIVHSGDQQHATFSYHFDSTQSAEGAMTVGDKASLGQSHLQLDDHVSMLAYVRPNS